MTIVRNLDQNNKEAVTLRDEGCERAAAKHRDDVADLQRRVICHLRERGPDTIDAADHPDAHRQKFAPMQGNWRGAAIGTLAQAGIIQRTGEWRRSRRPSRHATWNPVWQLADDAKAQAFLDGLPCVTP